jgi:hypothetical protein
LAIGRGITLSLEERPSICAQADGELLGKSSSTLSPTASAMRKQLSGFDVKKEGRFAVITVEDDGPGVCPGRTRRICLSVFIKEKMGIWAGAGNCQILRRKYGGSIRAFLTVLRRVF